MSLIDAANRLLAIGLLIRDSRAVVQARLIRYEPDSQGGRPHLRLHRLFPGRG